MNEIKRPDWKKIVSESGGSRIFLPEKFVKKGNEIRKMLSTD